MKPIIGLLSILYLSSLSYGQTIMETIKDNGIEKINILDITKIIFFNDTMIIQDKNKRIAISSIKKILFTEKKEDSLVTQTNVKFLASRLNTFSTYPNPFKTTVCLDLSLSGSNQVSITVFNSLGQKIRTICRDKSVSGNYKVVWDGKNESSQFVKSGVYIMRIVTNGKCQTKTLIK